MRTVTVFRALWGVLGLATIVTAGAFGTHLITTAGVSSHNAEAQAPLTFTVRGTVTSVIVRSYGDDVSVNVGDVRQVRVSEQLNYDPQDGGAPPLQQTVSHGQLTLGDPACFYGGYNCDVSYAVTVPPGVSATVQSYGGEVTVSGTAGADVDSYGGSVIATRIAGPLTVTTGGGNLVMRDVTGAVSADTYGGTLTAFGVAAATATVTTGGGDASLAFTAPPDQVMVSTDGGTAALTLPGGPYALTASDDQGGTWIKVPTSPTAHRQITVTTSGGPINIHP